MNKPRSRSSASPEQVFPQSRINIGKQFQRFGELSSFYEFSLRLQTNMMMLDSRPLKPGGAPKLVIFANGTDWPLSRLAPGLDEEVARWLRRWDQWDYSIPLNGLQQAFVMLRQEWIIRSDYSHDLPQSRWLDCARTVISFGSRRSSALMSWLFGASSGVSSLSVGEIKRSGLTVRQLSALRPCRCSQCKAHVSPVFSDASAALSRLRHLAEGNAPARTRLS